MEAALIALVGVLVGALLAEHFRRGNRIEAYSQKVFERRLEIYEELMKRVQGAYAVACDVIDDNSLNMEDRHAEISEAIHSIAGYVDENALYVDSYIAADCTAVFIGVEEFPDIEDLNERARAVQNFRSQYVAAKRNILEDSGIRQINDHFKLVSKAKVDSSLIKHLKELEGKRAAQ